MAERCEVLFLSAPVGSGHIRAAHAIGSALKELSPSIHVGYANVFDFFNPRLGNGLLKTYLRILDYFPALYGQAYQWGNSSRLAVAGRELISRYLARQMHEYIRTSSPQAIVCTHATPAGLIAHLCRTGKISVPVFAVVTDFVVHRLWVYPEIPGYFVAHDQLSCYLNEQGVKDNGCHALGIPVDEKFAAAHQREDLLAALGLAPDRPTLLIMGGGAGVMPMPDIISACEQIGEKLQIIAVAGNNAGLKSKLVSLAPGLKNCTLLAMGFVNNVHELMAAADLLVSKPGGMTAAEALCRGLPLIIYRPIPGQEEANTRFLTSRSAAEAAYSLEELKAKITDLLFTTPERLALLRRNAAQLGRPTAARDIAQMVLAALQ